MNTTWSGGVDIDLDRVEQVDRQMPLLQAYQQRAGMPPLAGVPELYLSEADLQFAQQLPANREVIACHALAAPAGQVWPRESWVRLVEILRDHQYLVLLLGRGEQYDLRVEGTFSVADRKLSLSQLAALIHRARFFIGPAASGLCEVARAVGRPAVVIGEHEASLATPLECLPRAASLENAAGAAAQETTSLNAVLTLVAELLGASAD
jgi:ADP-heptose:LPS heptosyltransferase